MYIPFLPLHLTQIAKWIKKIVTFLLKLSHNYKYPHSYSFYVKMAKIATPDKHHSAIFCETFMNSSYFFVFLNF